MKLNQKGFSVVEILIVIVVVGLIGTVGWLVYDRQQNKQTTTNAPSTTQVNEQKPAEQTQATPKPLEKGTFGEKGEYGTFQAEGYTTTVKGEEGMFCEENCKEYDYVFFNITKSENTKIFDYMNSHAGNSFVQDKAIGMGCVASGVISYSNSSDTVDEKEYTISKDDTQKILSATKEKPVRLAVERLEYTGGRGAPTCYSHFATFKVIN